MLVISYPTLESIYETPEGDSPAERISRARQPTVRGVATSGHGKVSDLPLAFQISLTPDERGTSLGKALSPWPDSTRVLPVAGFG
ncbi:hypothetical protein PAAG_12071 [Paracoccidioides lutzii Pb01]|uniref:Uncharacterized protein n=1 Tax=Paracoccidioides lutzii (strain ATCC MYA-826 / Pb01) TaxID=502779 RepID=A0A0A2V167_PARBA|nr:hypothetical protein PAAG_12071 [Paracoccidioides lutzii Pb01]KGQ01213.1 hypothetical protein PAAG_12071 [Paracoccidioides lutzii Pb01]